MDETDWIAVQNMKIYMSNETKTPPGWARTYTVAATIQMLTTREVTHLSCDNDLGEGEPEGFTCLDWLEDTIYHDPTFPMPEMYVHSANPTRAEYMKRTISSIKKIRQDQIDEE
jgi:hypothetical protein